ncbi:MAG: hypothetical protein ACPGU1_07355 [Myxococcota bacterium]
MTRSVDLTNEEMPGGVQGYLLWTDDARSAGIGCLVSVAPPYALGDAALPQEDVIWSVRGREC